MIKVELPAYLQLELIVNSDKQAKWPWIESTPIGESMVGSLKEVVDSGSPSDSYLWLDDEIRNLKGLTALELDWNTYGAPAPNKIAVENATNALRLFSKVDVRPDRVAPSAEGGIAISFFEGERYSDIECFNSGEIAAIVSDATNREVWEVAESELQTSLERIVEYVGRRCNRKNAKQPVSSSPYVFCYRRALLSVSEGSSGTKWRPSAVLDSMSQYLGK